MASSSGSGKRRAPGGGRGKSAIPGGASRTKFECVVCKKELRTDNLRTHYNTKVKFIDGKPIPKLSDAFKQLSKDEKLHTAYFLDKGFDRRRHPPNRVMTGTQKKGLGLNKTLVEVKPFNVKCTSFVIF